MHLHMVGPRPPPGDRVIFTLSVYSIVLLIKHIRPSTEALAPALARPCASRPVEIAIRLGLSGSAGGRCLRVAGAKRHREISGRWLSGALSGDRNSTGQQSELTQAPSTSCSDLVPSDRAGRASGGLAGVIWN